MRCVACWFSLSGRVHSQATMTVNGQSVCDSHADVAFRTMSLDHLVLAEALDKYEENEGKPE